MSQKKVDRYKEEKANRQQLMKKQKRTLRMELIALVAVLALLVGWFTTAVVHQARSSAAKQVVTTEIATGALEDYLNEMSDQVNQADEQ